MSSVSSHWCCRIEYWSIIAVRHCALLLWRMPSLHRAGIVNVIIDLVAAFAGILFITLTWVSTWDAVRMGTKLNFRPTLSSRLFYSGKRASDRKSNWDWINVPQAWCNSGLASCLFCFSLLMISRSLIALMRIIAVIVGILQIKGIVVCIFYMTLMLIMNS